MPFSVLAMSVYMPEYLVLHHFQQKMFLQDWYLWKMLQKIINSAFNLQAALESRHSCNQGWAILPKNYITIFFLKYLNNDITYNTEIFGQTWGHSLGKILPACAQLSYLKERVARMVEILAKFWHQYGHGGWSSLVFAWIQLGKRQKLVSVCASDKLSV